MNAAGDGEWGIALRCAQIDPAAPQRLRLFAGCGIVAGSDPTVELAEAEAKFLAVRRALEP
jgi:menaquinone-specific isochorismate synthase